MRVTRSSRRCLVGTGKTDPADIYTDQQDGFMMQHAGDKNLWGKGIYFAEKAAYSNVDQYVFQVRFPMGWGRRVPVLLSDRASIRVPGRGRGHAGGRGLPGAAAGKSRGRRGGGPRKEDGQNAQIPAKAR